MTPSVTEPITLTKTQLAHLVDHTKLTFAEGEDQEQAIRTLCAEAREYHFRAVCVRPQHITLAKECLNGSSVMVATVIGFPQSKLELSDEQTNPTVGNFSLTHKLEEVALTLADGVDELDLVIDVARFRENHENTRAELKAVFDASQGKAIKVIVETDLHDAQAIIKLTQLCAETGVATIKTSTGMLNGGKGAVVETVALIRETIDTHNLTLDIKASGGVKTLEHAQRLADLKVDRIGTSSGITLVSAL